ncbi:MAG: STAS domain-containing protein [Humibacillus sp.]
MTVETVDHDGARALEVHLDQATLVHDLTLLRRELPRVLLDGHGTVTVDLGSVDRLSSATVAALLRLKRLCLVHGVEMRVRNPRGRGRSVMRRCGLLETEGVSVLGARS